MKEPQDAGKYRVDNDGTVQGQVIGDNNKVELHFHGPQDKATSPPSPVLPSVQQQDHTSNYHSCVLSYATEDQSFAEKLHTDLTQQGVSCWFALEDLKIGDEFRARIYESIRIYDKLLLILSEYSVKSPWVETEVETAFEKEHKSGKLTLFPIKLDNSVMETDQAWAADIRRKRHIGDFTHWKEHDQYQKGLTRLLRDLKQEAIKDTTEDDAGKYQVDNDGTMQRQVIDDHNNVELHGSGSDLTTKEPPQSSSSGQAPNVDAKQDHPSSPTHFPEHKSISRRAVLLATIVVVGTGIGIFNIFHRSSTVPQTQTQSTTTASATVSATAPVPTPGSVWHTQKPRTSNVLSAVAWGGSRFVAVGDAGTILTSPDGHTWAILQIWPIQTSKTTLCAITWSGSQFVAVGWFGTILTSSDGSSWTTHHIAGNPLAGNPPLLHGIASSASRFVAVGNGGTILTSS